MDPTREIIEEPAAEDLVRNYGRLRELAARHLARERPDHTLGATALVHEVWLRLARYATDHALDERETELLCSHVMRRVLTDHARERGARKRDGGVRQRFEELEHVSAPLQASAVVLDVDQALTRLARFDPELARIVELRFFGGHTMARIATWTGLSERSLKRRWALARAWLMDALAGTQESATEDENA